MSLLSISNIFQRIAQSIKALCAVPAQRPMFITFKLNGGANVSQMGNISLLPPHLHASSLESQSEKGKRPRANLKPQRLAPASPGKQRPGKSLQGSVPSALSLPSSEFRVPSSEFCIFALFTLFTLFSIPHFSLFRSSKYYWRVPPTRSLCQSTSPFVSVSNFR